MGLWSRLRAGLRQRIVDALTRLLTKQLRTYEQRVANNLDLLVKHVRPGDVILVEGDQRVSQVIRYLTQSSWSHSTLYIGDELRRLKPALADALRTQYGDAAQALIIEAEAGPGVVCAPVAKYERYNLRVCRPRGLRREDLTHIIDELVRQIGVPYDVQHIFDLALYFFPVGLIPARFRRAVLLSGGRQTREVICSTMLARAFANVGYPILPRVTIDPAPPAPGWWPPILRRRTTRMRARFRERNLAMITPRDFDLSPYFDIIKFNELAEGRFDYRRITWSKDEEQDAAAISRSA